MPHHCLGSVWSRRDKSKGSRATSVVVTVDQFNAVSFRVISTVLMDVEMKISSRARLISKWIDVAQVDTRVLLFCSVLMMTISFKFPFPLLEIENAEKFLITQSNNLRSTIKPSLQVEKGMAICSTVCELRYPDVLLIR